VITTSRRLALHDGALQMHCVTWGQPSAPAVVMLHGLRAYGKWFEEFAEAAETDFFMIAPDQRGRGSTDWATDGKYDTDAYVADLLQLADRWPIWRLDPAIFPLRPDPPERSWSALAAIECPTLVVRAGDSDLVAVECADRMVQTLKQGEGASVPNAGHMVLEDNPEGFTRLARPFLKKHLCA